MTIDEKLSFNGVHARTGAYLLDPMSTQQLVDIAMGKPPEESDDQRQHVAELRARHQAKDAAHFGVVQGVDATKLDETGWGVIFPATKPGTPEAAEQDAIYEALSPLLSLRRAQATKRHEHYYKEYRGGDGYRPGDTKPKFLARNGVGPGPADPNKVPYYLLIVASPQIIAFHDQYQLDVQYAVGRIHFDTIEEYANYARSVVAAETGGLVLARELAFVGVSNPDDRATEASRQYLVAPLADLAESWSSVPEIGQWKVTRHFDDNAKKSDVSDLFGGSRTPALLFTASHGMGFDKGDPLQLRHQGALLLQDWPGPKQWRGPIDERMYFSGDDLSADASLHGMIAFNFACYGGGTPQHDEFARQARKQREEIADRAFVANLPRKLLGHPKGGALAAIGHVERAWGYSFMWPTGPRSISAPQLAAFESVLRSLMSGVPVGHALEYFNARYSEIASDLSGVLEQLEWDPDVIDPFSLANLWTSNNDARGYAITGDPAVRLHLDPRTDAPARARGSIEIANVANSAAQPSSAIEFGWFGRSETEEVASEEQAPDAEPGALRSFADKLLRTLGDAIESTLTLEVRTYVSDDPNAAAASKSATLASEGDLRAFTRIAIDGDTDVIIPRRDGEVDTEIWKIHLEMVKQAQEARAQTLQMVITAVSSLGKL